MAKYSTNKYLGEVINNKGNLSDHITEIEKKVRGATAAILAETGNTEFKGIEMKAIWQMVDAIIIPIITYSCEGWSTNKEENKKLQSIFNEALKTILYLPQGTSITILFNETGNLPIEYIIKKKQILQAKRIDEMKEESLIKDATKTTHSRWRENVEKTAEELHLKDVLLITNKISLKRLIQDEISTKNPWRHRKWNPKQNQGQALEGEKGKHTGQKKTGLHGQTNKKTMQCHNKNKILDAHSEGKL